MHEDVTRISGFSVSVAVDEMLDSVNEDQLKEAYQNAKDALEAVYNSMIAKLENV